jgi:RNA polymerase sigma-70 factor (ECF subfamily)
MATAQCAPDRQSWVQPDWTATVSRILEGDLAAERELCDGLGRGLRFMVARRLDNGHEVDDVVNDVLFATIKNIRAGKLEDPSRLLGYVQSIVSYKVIHCIRERMRSRSSNVLIEDVFVADRKETPEQAAIRAERSEIVRRTLESLSSIQREVLTRFYVDEQSHSQICAEMHLSETQFRLLKTRAKQRFGEVGRRTTAGMGLRRLVGYATA